MVNYYECWQPTRSASIVLRARSRPVMELLHAQDRKRQLLPLFCPILPAKVPFQNQTAAALFCLIVTTSYESRAFGRGRPSHFPVCTHFCLLVPFLSGWTEWKLWSKMRCVLNGAAHGCHAVLRSRDRSRVDWRRALGIIHAQVCPSCCSDWVSEHLAMPWHFPTREMLRWGIRGEDTAVLTWVWRVSWAWQVSWRRASLVSCILHCVPKFATESASWWRGWDSSQLSESSPECVRFDLADVI